jgi:hypothetical protein
MATIRRDLQIAAPPADVWAALADFGGVHRRVAPGFVQECRSDGADRIVTFANGALARERLVGLDAATRRLAYTVVEGRLPTSHHQASVEVLDVPGDDEACRLVWITDVLPDDLVAPIAVLMDAGSEAMVRCLSTSPAPTTAEGARQCQRRPGLAEG